MNDSLLALLQKVDTPTVCNAIEVAQGKRGFNDFTKGTMLCSAPEAGAIVGYARTASIAAVAPPEEPTDVIKARRMDYYRHMAEGPRPAIAVVEDVDYPYAVGAYWGEVNTNIHKSFSMAGALTNGVMRDLGDLPDDFPVIAGSIGPSHGFVHVKTIGQGANIFGLHVPDGSLIHADQHGALVIPNDVIDHLEDAIKTLFKSEKEILVPSKAGKMSFEDFEKAWVAFEVART
jgi:regulator of RNase E activity RraA